MPALVMLLEGEPARRRCHDLQQQNRNITQPRRLTRYRGSGGFLQSSQQALVNSTEGPLFITRL